MAVKKKLLLTGSRGFFGSRFKSAFGSDFEILATNSSSLNITDPAAVHDTVASFSPDIIVHAAAIALTGYCNDNPERCREINVSGTEYIAEAAEKAGSRLVFLSTEQVFNGCRRPGPFDENDIPCPDTEYGRNKLEAEKIIINTCRDYLILRLTWMFGLPAKSQPVADNILWSTLTNIMKGKPFRVPANEFRGLTDIDELMSGFIRILDLPPGTYHTGSENPLDRYDTVCSIFRSMGLEKRIPELLIRDEEKYRLKVRDVRLNTSLINSMGVRFRESPEALHRCIVENYLAV